MRLQPLRSGPRAPVCGTGALGPAEKFPRPKNQTVGLPFVRESSHTATRPGRPPSRSRGRRTPPLQVERDVTQPHRVVDLRQGAVKRCVYLTDGAPQFLPPAQPKIFHALENKGEFRGFFELKLNSRSSLGQRFE